MSYSCSLLLDRDCEKLAYNCSNLCLLGLQPHLKHSLLQPLTIASKHHTAMHLQPITAELQYGYPWAQCRPVTTNRRSEHPYCTYIWQACCV